MNSTSSKFDGEWFALTDTGVKEASSLGASVCRALAVAGDADIVLISSLAGAGIDTWSVFPASVAVLLESPQPFRSAVVRRSAWKAVGGLEEDRAPVWQWLVRAATRGCRFFVEPLPASCGEWTAEPTELHLPELVPATPGVALDWLRPFLDSFDPTSLGGGRLSPDATALKAGLWQWHDELDLSHQAAQSIEGEGMHRAGDYWHAIMHRREPDYGNAKYWFRRVGRSPLFTSLAESAVAIFAESGSPAVVEWQSRLLPGGRWDAAAFVDFCEWGSRTLDPEGNRVARRIQREEMLLLLRLTLDDLFS